MNAQTLSTATGALPGIIEALPRGARVSAAKMPGPKQSTMQIQDLLFRSVARFFASLVLLLLLGIVVSLVYGSLPSIRAFGLGFLVSSEWNPVTEQFGALVPIVGTLVTSAIALLIGVPVSFGIALFLTELSPAGSSALSAPPSNSSRRIPRSSMACGACSCSRRSLRITCSRGSSARWRDSARRCALQGAAPGHWRAHARVRAGDHGDPVHRVGDARRVRDRAAGAERVGLRHRLHDVGSRRNIVLPYTKVGVIGGIMLGLGRALGETMAVTSSSAMRTG
jgi:phosphate transport system permease protein